MFAMVLPNLPNPTRANHFLRELLCMFAMVLPNLPNPTRAISFLARIVRHVCHGIAQPTQPNTSDSISCESFSACLPWCCPTYQTRRKRLLARVALHVCHGIAQTTQPDASDFLRELLCMFAMVSPNLPNPTRAISCENCSACLPWYCPTYPTRRERFLARVATLCMFAMVLLNLPNPTRAMPFLAGMVLHVCHGIAQPTQPNTSDCMFTMVFPNLSNPTQATPCESCSACLPWYCATCPTQHERLSARVALHVYHGAAQPTQPAANDFLRELLCMFAMVFPNPPNPTRATSCENCSACLPWYCPTYPTQHERLLARVSLRMMCAMVLPNLPNPTQLERLLARVALHVCHGIAKPTQPDASDFLRELLCMFTMVLPNLRAFRVESFDVGAMG